MSFWDTRKIYPSIITSLNGDWVSPGSGDWRSFVSDASELGLAEVCLFITGLEKNGREELYGLLEKTKIKRIPLVHLRSDMAADEIEYLIKRFGAQVFNTHMERINPLEHDLSQFKDKIFIENHPLPFDEQELQRWAGICWDAAHLEACRIKAPDVYRQNIEMMERFPIGCAHLSAIREKMPAGVRPDWHTLFDLADMDYLKKYPAKFFPKVMALELTNPLSRQLEICAYVRKLLADKEG